MRRHLRAAAERRQRHRGHRASTEQAQKPRSEHDPREGHVEEEDRHEGRSGDGPFGSVSKSPSPDAQERLEHEGQDGGLDPEEEPLDERHVAEAHVQQAQREDREEAREHEQKPGHQPAERSMEQPADVGRELLCLRTREQHAVRERVEEALLRHPALFFHENAVHHRNLACGSTEALERDPAPRAKSLAEFWHGCRRPLVEPDAARSGSSYSLKNRLPSPPVERQRRRILPGVRSRSPDERPSTVSARRGIEPRARDLRREHGIRNLYK